MKGLIKYIFAAGLLFGCEADESKESLILQSQPVRLVKHVSQDWSITGTAKYCVNDSDVEIFVHSYIKDDKGIKQAGIAFDEEFSDDMFVISGGCDRIFPNAIYHIQEEFTAYGIEDIWLFYENCSDERHGIKLEEVDCDSI